MARLARTRNGVEAPQLAARLGIQGYRPAHITRSPLQTPKQDAIGIDRRCVKILSRLRLISKIPAPYQLTCLFIQSDGAAIHEPNEYQAFSYSRSFTVWHSTTRR